jgi:amidase
MLPAALGTQTAGSGLRPAAYCGVIGLKPTYGRVSRRGIWPLCWSFDTAAVHARTVADAVLILQAIAGPDPGDPTTLHLPRIDWASLRPAEQPPRLGLVREMVDHADPEVREDVLTTAGRLTAAGARVQEVRLPFANEDMIAVHHVVQQVEAAVCNQDLFGRHAEGYPARFRAYLEVGESIPGAAYVEAQRVRRRMFEAVDALFADLDALLLPTAAGTAPAADSTGSYVMLAGWTMLGLPAATVPSGLSQARLPLAIQLVGQFGQDASLVQAASWCEHVLGPLAAPHIQVPGAVA